MAVLGVNSRAASLFKKVDFTVAWVKMAKTRRARIDAENGHRRVTRPSLRIIEAETQGYPTGHLRAPSDAIQHDPKSREVGCETSFFLGGYWISRDHWGFVLFCVFLGFLAEGEPVALPSAKHEVKQHRHYCPLPLASSPGAGVKQQQQHKAQRTRRNQGVLPTRIGFG